jgi:hypothetical protein
MLHRSVRFFLVVFALGGLFIQSVSAQEVATPDVSVAKKADAVAAAKEKKKGWKPLFNGKDLKGWKVTNFGGEGEVTVGDKGDVTIEEGVDLSGITTTRNDLPTTNYEVEFEAQRAKGTDFFVGYTFPVGDSACSLVMGGWGGGVCGISSLDFMDASENETTQYRDFVRGKWYKIRVRVTDTHIQAWQGKWTLANVEHASCKVDVRFEMEASKPMGFATYQTVGKIRNARIRTLTADEVKAKP